jgi:molecular chaperone DnaK
LSLVQTKALEGDDPEAIAAAVTKLQEASHKLAEIVYADTQKQEPGGDPEAEDNGTKSKKSDAVDADCEVVAD